MLMHKLKVIMVWSILLTLTCTTQTALAQGIGYWDLFCMNLTPNDLYWNQVDGGYGSLSDPLVSPDPTGNPIIDYTTPLGGVAYGFGGRDWGSGTLELTATNNNIIQLLGESDYYLNIILDTSTLSANDSFYPSWGIINDIIVQPSDGAGGWLDPIEVSWIKSPFDPNGLDQIIPNATTVCLAPSDFDVPESATQTSGIYGVGAELPSALGYKVTFTTSLSTWDSYTMYTPVPLYWNPDVGGTGTWDTSSTKWRDSWTSPPDVVWDNTGDASAIFQGAGGDVSIQTGGVNVNYLTFNVDGYTIQNLPGQTDYLTITTSASIIVTNDTDTATISARISNAGFTKMGAGTLILSSSNDLSGFINVDEGALRIANSNALGNASPVTVQGGGVISRIELDGSTSALTIGNTITLLGRYFDNPHLVNYGGNNTMNGDISLIEGGQAYYIQSDADTLTINNIKNNSIEIDTRFLYFQGDGNCIINGVIGGSGSAENPDDISITKLGSGALTLSGSNTYTGGTTLNTGTLNINHAAALGAGTFTIGDGTTIDNTSGDAITLSTNNTQSWAGNFNFAGSHNLNLGTGAVTLDANPTVTVSAGTLTVGGGIKNGAGTSLTKAGNGTLILSGTETYTGGTTIDAGTLQLSTGAKLAPTGAITITGGMFDLGGNNQTTSGAVSFQGGTVQNGTITKSGAAYDGRAGTVSANLAGGVALSKSTTGTLTLSGSNTYTGATTISGGTLVLKSTGSINTSGTVQVNSGAYFDVSDFSSGYTIPGSQRLLGSGTVQGDVIVSGSASVLPGADGGVGVFSFQNNLTLGNGGTVKFDLANNPLPSNNDRIDVTQNLVLPSGSDSTTFAINMLNGYLTTSPYTLFTYQGTSSGDISNVNLSGASTMRHILSNNTTLKEIDLTISSTSLIWKGNVNSNWDFGTTNWTWASSGSADKYYDLDTVTFDNSSSTQTVDIKNKVYPGTVTVSSDLNYTFQGTGAIGGGATMTLTKSGTGKLTIRNTGINTYGGTTTINSGVLQVGYNTSGGGIGTGDVVNNGALVYYRADDSAISASISGSGSFEKRGYGRLTLSGSNSFTGPTTIFDGKLRFTNNNALGNPSSISVSGSNYTGGIELDGSTSPLTIGNTIILAGRNNASPHLVNYSGNNTISGDLSLVEGGQYYFIQSNNTAALTLNNIKNNSTQTGTRLLNFQGEGNFLVNGVIGAGSAAYPNDISVTKGGGGTLTLSGSNTYTGATTITSGTLALKSTGSLHNTASVQVDYGAYFDVSDFSGGYTLPGSQQLLGHGTVQGSVILSGSASVLPGTDGEVGVLSFQNNLTLGSPTGGTVKFDLADITDPDSNDRIDITQNLVLPSGSDSTTFAINMLNSYLTTSPYKLFTYQGTSSGDINKVTLSGVNTMRHVSLSDNTTAKEIDLTVNPASLIWKGNLNNNWDFSTTNWSNSGSADKFYDCDNVTFDNSSLTQTVDIKSLVHPAMITVNSNLDYTFQGTGALVGTTMTFIKSGAGKLTIQNTGTNTFGSLTQNGSGTLVLAGANNFTGPIAIQDNGILQLKHADALGDYTATSTGISISGGTDTSRLEFADNGSGGYTLTAMPIITLSGRQATNSSPHINNLSGNNTFYGNINLAGDGNNYTIQSDSGKLTLYSILDSVPSACFLYLKGAGDGEITSYISEYPYYEPFSIIKEGTGTWTISGYCYNNGATIINTGTLALVDWGYIGSPLIHIKSGATFDVSAVSGGYILYPNQTLAGNGIVKGDVTTQSGWTGANGSIIAPGSSIGILTFNNNLTLVGGGIEYGDSITYELDGDSGDLLDVKGDLTLCGTTDYETLINPIILSSPTTSSYRVASVTGTLTGSNECIKVNNQTRYTITSTVTSGSGGHIDLSVSGSNASLIWNGSDSPNDVWDIKTTNNWLNSGSADMFYQSDAVTFNDSASNTMVTINTTVRPMSITVNADKDYTFIGTGKITGTTGLTKTGTGTLTISITNDYSGGTTISGGILSVGDNANLGDAAGHLTFDGGKLAATGTITMERPITLNSTGGFIDTGTNLVEIAGSQNTTWHAGTLTVDGSIGGTLRLNRSGGTVTVDSGATLQIDDNATLELTGTPATKQDANFLNIINTSLGSLLVSGTATQEVGVVTGMGTTQIASGAKLSVTSLAQAHVSIAAGAKLTIRGALSGPLSEGMALSPITPVPEPTTWIMLILATLGLGMYWYRVKNI